METSPLVLAAPAAPAAPDAPVCASCGTSLAGGYCHACGEKRLHRHDYALKHFLEHTVDTVTHFDLRVLRDLWWQVRRPGFLATEWLHGRRVRHAQPVQLFLITNLLFYLIVSVSHFSPFETSLQSQMHSLNGFSPLASSMVSKHLQQTGISAVSYARHVDSLAHTYSKSLVFLFIPLMVGPIWLLYRRQRRYFVEWVMISTFLFAGILLLYAIMALVALSWHFSTTLAYLFSNDGLVGPFMLLLTVAYAAAFFKRAFPSEAGGSFWRKTLASGTRWGKAIVYALLFSLTLLVPYRFVLFLVCYWAAK